MKARIIRGLIETGSAARDYIRQVCGTNATPSRAANESTTTRGAPRILEVFTNHRRQQDSGHILTGQRVIAAMNEQLRAYSSAGEQFSDWVSRGCRVSISGDDRPFTVIKILWEQEAIRVRSIDGSDYVVPFKIVGPWPNEDDEQALCRGTDDESDR